MSYEVPEDTEIKARYTALSETRSSYLDRFEKYAKLTLPYIMPDNEDAADSELPLDYSTVGAEYVNHLANVYVDEMFPSHRSFFKLTMPIESMDKAMEPNTDIEVQFAKVEKQAR